jgi:hypothetical protein
MRPIDVFGSPDVGDTVVPLVDRLTNVLSGQVIAVGMAALFNAFVAVAAQSKFDAGTEFEAMLAVYEARKEATHRSHPTIN